MPRSLRSFRLAAAAAEPWDRWTRLPGSMAVDGSADDQDWDAWRKQEKIEAMQDALPSAPRRSQDSPVPEAAGASRSATPVSDADLPPWLPPVPALQRRACLARVPGHAGGSTGLVVQVGNA